MQVYRELRQAARETPAQVHSKGYTAVRAVGRDEVVLHIEEIHAQTRI